MMRLCAEVIRNSTPWCHFVSDNSLRDCCFGNHLRSVWCHVKVSSYSNMTRNYHCFLNHFSYMFMNVKIHLTWPWTCPIGSVVCDANNNYTPRRIRDHGESCSDGLSWLTSNRWMVEYMTYFWQGPSLTLQFHAWPCNTMVDYELPCSIVNNHGCLWSSMT